MTAETLTSLGPRIVGLVFIAAALMKTAAPRSFYRHIDLLKLVPSTAARVGTPIIIGLEAGWGVALGVALWPRVVLSFTAIALVLLTGFTWWSVRSGRAADCGCYGDLVAPSVGQSVGLNAVYLLLVVVAGATLPQSASPALWQIASVAVTVAVVGGVTEYALRSELSTGRPLFTPSGLEMGGRWKPRWGGRLKSRDGRDQLVSYLGPSCPYCKDWVRVLNVINATPNLPPVTAVLGASPATIETFVKENGVQFPVARISEGLMQRLASAVPTTVLVEGDVIRDKWVGQMSPEFVERFKRAFFPAAATTQSRQPQVAG